MHVSVVRDHESRFWLLLVAGLVGCGGGGSGVEVPPAPEFARRIVLTGPEGARVRIAEYGDDEAMFSFGGVRSPAAGFVFRGKVNAESSRTTYQTTWDGRDYYPIHRESNGGTVRWQLYAIGLPEAVELQWDEQASAALDADALYDEHAAQLRDGSLARVQQFDRAAAEADVEGELAGEIERVAEECGSTPEMTVVWASIEDTLFTTDRISVASYCGTVLGAMRNLCRFEPGKAFVRDRAARVTCTWSDEWSLDARDGSLAFVAADTTNLEQKAVEALLDMESAPDMTLRQAVDYARTDVCASPDGSRLLVVHPHISESLMGISYGTAERLYHTPQTQYLGRGWFFEPREFAAGHNENFRGMDMRYHSYVEVDEEADTCTLTCGERESTWTRLPPDRVVSTLRGAETVLGPFDREPYALARDRRGTYYYVDRGNREETAQDFHVYRGARGNVRRLEMRDVASDSEGEVFSTGSGDLRLIVDTERAQWIQQSRSQDLRRIPVRENYRLIYGELGVYLGARFELPCDDY